MNYHFQLVIQFPENELYGDLDWIEEMEDKFIESLTDAKLDGHDIGSGEVNIFIHTNNPNNTFELVKNILKEDNPAHLDFIKVAYRDYDNDHFFCIWPEGLTEFDII